MYVWGPSGRVREPRVRHLPEATEPPGSFAARNRRRGAPIPPDPLDFSNASIAGKILQLISRCRGLFKDRPFDLRTNATSQHALHALSQDHDVRVPSDVLCLICRMRLPRRYETFSNLHKASWIVFVMTLRMESFDPLDPMVCWVVQRVITNMIGRSWFPAGMFDSLQMFVHFLGLGGTGKTIVQNFIKTFFPTHEIGIVANNAQRTFPFGVCLNPYTDEPKRCVMFPEIRNDFQVDFTDILRLCEHVKDFVYNLKGRKPVIAPFIATPFIASNTRFGNDGGAQAAACVVEFLKKSQETTWMVCCSNKLMQARDWRNHSVRQFWISPVSA